MAKNDQASMPTIIVIFGATGDLTGRKLVPALFDLYRKGLLPPLIQIVGFARRDMPVAEWQEQVRAMCRTLAPDQEQLIEDFSRLFTYQAGQFQDAVGYQELATSLGMKDKEWKTCANKLFYLAVPPIFYGDIVQQLHDSHLTDPCSAEEGWTRVVVEKPFGKDLASAQELDGLLARLFKEEQIYRIDHYLGKETVQNILAFRFSNAFLEPAWDNRSIERIHLRFWEEAGIEGRGEFYDATGALRDVGQNHLLQMLALFTMENPGEFTAEAVRARRTQVLSALQPMTEAAVTAQSVRGQYEGYGQEEGVREGSNTETYFRLQTGLQLPAWQGVPIILEAGKKMNESVVDAIVTFRHHMPCLCPAGQHYQTTLRYRIQPQEGVRISFWVKKPGAQMVIEEKDFAFDYAAAFSKESFLDAYVKLFLDAIRGDQTLFVSTPEILASWNYIDPIEEAWQKNTSPLLSYQAGSSGPPEPRPALPEAERRKIGYVGLGKMGLNMVSRLIRLGWEVAAYDPDEAARLSAAQLGARIVSSLAELKQELGEQALLWVMVPHQVVDSVLQELAAVLQPGDTIIDGGNSFYKDSIKRAQLLSAQKIHFLDVGVSGGPAGARDGACLMIGGQPDVYAKAHSLWRDLSTVGGFDYMGGSGAGHFVKMVHNGIEYGMMQAIAEGFALLKQSSFKLDVERIADLFNHGSVIESRLVGWLKLAYQEHGSDLGDISGAVAHSGEGEWTVQAAQELGIPVPVIKSALQFRLDSAEQPSYTGQIVSALRNQFGGHKVRL